MEGNSRWLYQRPSGGEEQVMQIIPVLDLHFQMNNISFFFEREGKKEKQT